MHSKYLVMCEFNEAGNANITEKALSFLSDSALRILVF